MQLTANMLVNMYLRWAVTLAYLIASAFAAFAIWNGQDPTISIIVAAAFIIAILVSTFVSITHDITCSEPGMTIPLSIVLVVGFAVSLLGACVNFGQPAMWLYLLFVLDFGCSLAAVLPTNSPKVARQQVNQKV